MQPPDEIVSHYQDRFPEGERLASGQGRLELARTQEVLLRHLPSESALRVLDVGGATGTYSAWLASLGHSVHLVDPVPLHVESASERGTFAASLGDARSLDFADASFDVALVFGPLYHLSDRADRVRALEEARRVVAPGGLVFAAAISRFASVFDGLARDFLTEPAFRSIAEQDLRDGQHRNPTDRPEWFTTAFFHHPDELRSEAADANLDVVDVVGLEGLAGWLPDVEERWAGEGRREAMLFAARAVEAEPALAGLSAHLLLVSRRVS